MSTMDRKRGREDSTSAGAGAGSGVGAGTTEEEELDEVAVAVTHMPLPARQLAAAMCDSGVSWATVQRKPLLEFLVLARLPGAPIYRIEEILRSDGVLFHANSEAVKRAFHQAASAGHTAAVILLFPMITIAKSQSHGMYLAARRGHMDTMDAILSCMTVPKDDSGNTLYVAVQMHNLVMVTHLLAHFPPEKRAIALREAVKGMGSRTLLNVMIIACKDDGMALASAMLCAVQENNNLAFEVLLPHVFKDIRHKPAPYLDTLHYITEVALTCKRWVMLRQMLGCEPQLLRMEQVLAQISRDNWMFMQIARSSLTAVQRRSTIAHARSVGAQKCLAVLT